MPLSDNTKKVLGVILRIVISIALLIFIFKQVDKKTLFGIIRTANPWLLLTAFLILSIPMIILS